jgi:hypothetical protein
VSRSLTAWSCWVSLAERSCSSFALTIVCRFSSLSFIDAVDDYEMEVRALSVGFRAGARSTCRVVKEGFHPRARLILL